MLKQLFTKQQLIEIVKYGLISVFSYLYILTTLYLLVDIFTVNTIASYVMVYSTMYVLEYILTLRAVFNKPHHWLKLIKFGVYIGTFLSLSTIIFSYMIHYNIQYLLATILTAGLLMPARFLTNKYFVYR